MTSRQTAWPRAWLMTDERMGDRLWPAIDRVASDGVGIVFRHHATDKDVRRLLAERVASIARRRNLVLAVARDIDLAQAVGADLVHNPERLPCPLPFSRSVHTIQEAENAREEGASLVFVSPVRTTRSHPGASALGKPLALQIARAAGVPAVALGGMNARTSAGLRRDGFYGWAGIDAWL